MPAGPQRSGKRDFLPPFVGSLRPERTCQTGSETKIRTWNGGVERFRPIVPKTFVARGGELDDRATRTDCFTSPSPSPVKMSGRSLIGTERLYFSLSFCSMPIMLAVKHHLQEYCQMEDIRFADVMRQERERLSYEREEILNQQKNLETKLTEITRELAAIDAYEAAKTGKAETLTRQPRGPRKIAASIEQSSAEPRPRPQREGRREALLKVIGENPNGLRRGEIFDRMGLKGNKSAEKSVSNALTALTKNSQVSRRAGKYVIGG
jgi:hypothetical protein